MKSLAKSSAVLLAALVLPAQTRKEIGIWRKVAADAGVKAE